MKIQEEPVTIDKEDSFKVVLSKYGALALDKQENLSELIGDLNGDLDLENATLSFGDIKLPVQVLGFFTEELKQWSWAWDSEDIFGGDLISAALEIKKIGDETDIPEFSNAIIQGDYNACHTLAMCAISILDYDGYYAVSEDGLDIFVAIDSDLIAENNSVEKFRDTFYTFQKNFSVYSKIALKSYAKLKGYRVKENNEFFVIYIGESRIIVGFTERGNVTHIQLLLEDE